MTIQERVEELELAVSKALATNGMSMEPAYMHQNRALLDVQVKLHDLKYEVRKNTSIKRALAFLRGQLDTETDQDEIADIQLLIRVLSR